MICWSWQVRRANYLGSIRHEPRSRFGTSTWEDARPTRSFLELGQRAYCKQTAVATLDIWRVGVKCPRAQASPAPPIASADPREAPPARTSVPEGHHVCPGKIQSTF